ncbi:MAG TPA: di-heme oxidoredictase family protein [Kofleriaceae bacterium]
MKAFVTASWILPTSLIIASCSSRDDVASPEPSGDPAASIAVATEGTGVHANAITEAVCGFDNLTNGFATQAAMDAALDVFANVETIADGLGPLYNGQSCRECHRNPVPGGGSQVTELRAGHFTGTSFVDPPGGSLISDLAIDPAFQELVPVGDEVHALRLSLSLMGDGYVEAIDNNTISAIAAAQPAAQRGTVISVPVLEVPGQVRVGRFGWKDQHASLLSCAAVEYLDEEGITSPLEPVDNTTLAQGGTASDTVADPEDVGGADISSFALFMRSLKCPPVDAARAATASAQSGSNLFNSIGCAVCHVRTITTVPAGTVINGGAFTVPAALGDKNIHPFCDFLLHDIGTGDGIVQNGGQGTRNQLRTACLWGLRVRPRLMHDGQSVTRADAILRHANQALTARNNFTALSAAQQQNVIDFLNSL